MDVIKRLEEGNAEYVKKGTLGGEISENRRKELSAGQSPYAVVVTCSDSRVVPEVIFNAGLGELFVIRVAGNVLSETELASIEYATHHLGVKTVVILGHTSCGAVTAALGKETGLVDAILTPIRKAIGMERNVDAAARKNVTWQVALCDSYFGAYGVKTVGALYDIRSGVVDFFIK